MGTPEIVWSCIALVISIASFVVAAYFYQWVKKLPVANARMEEVGKLIRDGAFTFLKREYRILGIFSAVVVVLIVLFFPEPIWHGAAGKNILMAVVYLFGTALSGLAGYVGISIATLSNVRSATAAQESIQKSFMAGFRGGAVMGMAVVGTSLAGRGNRLPDFRRSGNRYGLLLRRELAGAVCQGGRWHLYQDRRYRRRPDR